MKKYEFMYRMDKSLGALSESEKNDIINDYEEHFRIGSENGKTDDEICESLGNPEELAKSYLDGGEPKQEEQPEPERKSEPEAKTLPDYNESAVEKTDETNTAGLIAFILLTIFVFIPLGGTILSIIIGFFAASIGCVIGGIAVICCAFFTESIIAAMILLGIAITALGVLFGFATYYSCKGVYKLVLMLIDLCKKLLK